MVMGNKIVKIENALITIGGYVLSSLKEKEMTLDNLYIAFKKIYPKDVSFERFVYSIDFLFMIKTIEVTKDGKLRIKNAITSTN